MVRRDLRDLRAAAAAILVLWLMGACGGCGTSSSANAAGRPTQAELATASIGGHWRLTVVVQPYTGPQPPATNVFQSGHRGVDDVVFVSSCAAAGSCTLQLWGPNGPDPNKQAYFAFYSSATDLQGPPVTTPMTQSGATYSQTIPISGFGGYKCPPSRTVTRPEQRLTLTVTDAKKNGAGWSATAMTGTELFIAGWGCGSGGFTGWTVGHLAITGHPA